METWIKKGIIYRPNLNNWWSQHYAMLPVPKYLKKKEIIRIYFGTTDNKLNGRIASIDVNASNPSEVVSESKSFLVDLGEDGTFDDSGVVPSCIIKLGDKQLLFTVGFQRCVNVPYMLFAGLLYSKINQEKFIRYSKAPVLPRNKFRPISQGAPCVIFHNGIYKMWHWFGTKWITVNKKKYINYRIGYAESDDCYNWVMKKEPCIVPNASNNEFAVARPWVLFENNKFKMWYSVRFVDKLYRIAYAESLDGINWKKQKIKGLNVSKSGWDSKMICYPSVINVDKKKYMFYNGNDNGKTGFGYAILKK